MRFFFMFRGKLVLVDQYEPPRFHILAFHLDGGEAFALIDLQKQATPTLNPHEVDVPDALGMQGDYFLNLLFRKRAVIKTLLMEQHLMGALETPTRTKSFTMPVYLRFR
ncbi:hypothetical protein [Pedobacter mucosus]|uniref:hypothetical protein n=1 Tax=Pedobacter mucosus TaxID=2895286 RepID=UPI001EE3B25C|nr:hypothetical protein [Pedobacter mucosus]UKT65082.1 hypothetical protein LOK61_04720 [Pedobacter mucosus]